MTWSKCWWCRRRAYRHPRSARPILRAALADHHNLVWSLVDEVRLDQRNDVEIGHAVRPAAFARAKRYLACKDFVIRLLHRRDGPGLQDRIGKISNPIGWLLAGAVGHIRVGLIGGDRAGPARGRRKEIVDSKFAVEHPAGPVR